MERDANLDVEGDAAIGGEQTDRPAPRVIVGIGASAGGLEALSEFFANVPPDSGMAYVVIQHLAPHQKSHMAELLGRHTSVPVEFATEGVKLVANQVIVMPSDKHLSIDNGCLRLVRREQTGDFRDNLPIDAFLHALSLDQPFRCVAVILSGTGSDGTRGLRSIKEAGGLVVVQDEKSAKFDGMPRSAISTGLADVVLEPAAIPAYLVRYAERYTHELDERIIGNAALLKDLFDHVAHESGIDFNLYKRSTVIRRLQRRIAVTQVSDLVQYTDLVRRSAREAEALRNDLLIHVTAFFRDSDAWDLLAAEIPALIESCDPRDGLRIWVAACSTGEEAYTVALCIEECFARTGKRVPYKIFASDVDAMAVERASLGIYPTAVASDLPPAILQRYFVRKGSDYAIAREIREHVIFAQHNLISDPPFTRMDLITCRNLLIYLSPEVQERVVGVLQFALRRGGILMLGSSETLAKQLDTFETLHAKWKIYRSRHRSLRLLSDTLMSDLGSSRGPRIVDERQSSRDSLQALVSTIQSELIAKCLPPTVIVDSNRSMVRAFGDVSDFLRVPIGEATLDVGKMSAGELSMLLSTAIRRVTSDSDDLVFDNVAYSQDSELRARVTVRRLETLSGLRPLVAIQFQKRDAEGPSVTEDCDNTTRSRIVGLERELQYTRQSLQATVEELETTNEELQASNEELISANEELQSTNEELQSVNEELHTMNGEFQAKIEELTVSNDDFVNLMRTTSVGAIFLDRDLRIRRFTDAVRDLIGLVSGDLGRRLVDFKWRVSGRDISAAASKVLDSGEEEAFAVHDASGNWYWIRIRPYAAVDSHTSGVVISCVDITAEHNLERQYSDLATLTIGIAMPIAILDDEGKIHYANRAFSELTLIDDDELQGFGVAQILEPAVIQRIHRCHRYQDSWSGLGSGHRRDGSVFWATLRVAPVDNGEEPVRWAVLSIEEVRSVQPTPG